MAEDATDDVAVLSDVDGDNDPAPIVLPPAEDSSISVVDRRIRDLLAELDQERTARKAAEEAHAKLQANIPRFKALVQEALRKRDDAVRDRDEASRSADRAAAELADAIKLKDEAVRFNEEVLKQKDSVRSEMDTAAQMLVTGIEKISGKVGGFKNFSAGGLPRSQKYTGLPAVAYGVIKRTNEIVEELVKQIETAFKSRDQAREQMEQRNYEIAIEVSQLEATVAGLREEVSQKGEEIEGLEKVVAERDTRISEMEKEMDELRQFGEECNSKLRGLEVKLDSQRPLIMDQMNYTSRAYEQIHEIIRIVDTNALDQSESSDSLFMSKEVDMDENLRTSLEGTKSVCELAEIGLEKVREATEKRNEEANSFRKSVNELLMEKQHIGILLRSALSSKTNEVLQLAEDGLREAGIDLRLNGNHEESSERGHDDEVYTLAGALESTVKTSQLKIIELEHLVEALRAESSLLKAHLDSQAKEISQQKRQIKELEEKERIANESVEGLMMDIATAEEEIARWKAAAEQEAAAGRAIEQEFLAQLSTVRHELDETKQALSESEGKLKFKEETAFAAMAARDAAEKSLRLADMRATRLRERLEELTQQLEESETQHDSRSWHDPRYICWPWQWLGLNFVRSQTDMQQQSSNEMELSEPLI